MKKQLTVLAILIMSTLGLKAQQGEIIYTDFEPDLYVGALTYNFPHDTIKVDIDQDGTTDFKIFLGFVGSYGIVAQFTNYSPWYYRGKSGETDTIVPMANPNRWLCLYGNAVMFTYIDSPTVINDTFGFRKTIDGGNYYAWMTVNVTREINGIQGSHGTYDKVQAYVKEVAYCTIPDYPLQWGQTNITEGVEEETIENDFSIYPNPTDDVLFVQTLRAMSLPDQSYRIINLMGQTVLSGNINADTQQINIESLPAGMYFITVVGETRKFVVK